MMKKAMLSLLVAAAIAAPVHSKRPEPYVWPELGLEAKINFPNEGAIRNFEADGNDGLWLEDRQRRRYYAELHGGCQEIDFAQAIGFDTRGSATFDRFSTIVVAGDKCQLASLVTANKPLPRKERLKLRKQTLAAGREAAAPSN